MRSRASAPLRLDAAVFPARDALREAGVPDPDALLLLATGPGTLGGELEGRGEVELGAVAGVPRAWREGRLVHGRAGEGTLWLVVDAPGELQYGESTGEPAWTAGFPCWLARAAGAGACLHTSAGVRLPFEPGVGPVPGIGGLALVRDHLNLSGTTPLAGLGETRLGPLFPDQSRLHDAELRARALELALGRGLDACEAIAACTLGPALDTPAELRWLAAAGAGVAVQNLAAPLLACAHAGLALLAIVVPTDDGSRPLDLRALLARAERAAPALDELVRALFPDLLAAARRRAQA